MATPFRDFIPEGEDTGAQGQVFRDFVPASRPAAAPVAPVTADAPSLPVEPPPITKNRGGKK